MKNIIYLVLTLLIVSCGGDDIIVNNVDYFFEIEFAGTTHRVEGNTEEYPTSNICNSSIRVFSWVVGLGIFDKSASDYVSGENFSIVIDIENASLGINTGTLAIGDGSNDFFSNYLESIGCSLGNLFTETEISYSEFFEEFIGGGDPLNRVTNINITDLGTASAYYGGVDGTDWGETLKGSYEGVLWFQNKTTLDFDIPVPIKIEFEAVRLL